MKKNVYSTIWIIATLLLCLYAAKGYAQSDPTDKNEKELAILFQKRKDLRDSIKQFRDATNCDVIVTSSLDGEQAKPEKYLDMLANKVIEIFTNYASEVKDAIHINVVWKQEGKTYVIGNSIAVVTDNVSKNAFHEDEVLVFKNRLQGYRESVTTIASTGASEEIIWRLKELQKWKKEESTGTDKIRWALDSVAKYCGKTVYPSKQELGTLRTGSTAKDLQYMDCSELATRFVQLACGLKKVPLFTTADLAPIADAEGMYENFLQFVSGSGDKNFTDIQP
jgi:hypothetical protein